MDLSIDNSTHVEKNASITQNQLRGWQAGRRGSAKIFTYVKILARKETEAARLFYKTPGR